MKRASTLPGRRAAGAVKQIPATASQESTVEFGAGFLSIRREGVGRRLLKERPHGGTAVHGKQILVTASRELPVDHGRQFKRKLDALLEGTPA